MGIERHVVLRLGAGDAAVEVRCTVDPDHEKQLTRDEVTAAVHYVHFSLSPAEVEEDYEHFTGVAIVDRLRELNLSPLEMPAILQIHHAPFTFGKNAMDSLKNSIALEMCAQMALHSLALNPTLGPIPAHILEKHHQRKHGAAAYYGQA